MVPADTEHFQVNLERLRRCSRRRCGGAQSIRPTILRGRLLHRDHQADTRLWRRSRGSMEHDIFLISDEPYREIVFWQGGCAVSSEVPMTIRCPVILSQNPVPAGRADRVCGGKSGLRRMRELISAMCSRSPEERGHKCPPSNHTAGGGGGVGLTSDLSGL